MNDFAENSSENLMESDEVYVDEDVTLEGTPLHAYLNDLRLNEDDHLECQIRTNFHRHNYFNNFWHGTSLIEYFSLQWRLFRSKISNIFPVTEDVLVEMSRHYYTKYGQEILESKVILEEDLDFLCLQTPQQFLNRPRKEYSFTFSQCMQPGLYSRYSALITVYIACLIAFLLSPLVPNIFHVFLGIITLFVTGYNIRLQIIIEVWRRKHDSNLKALKTFIKSSETLHRLIRRSIRLVQEVEVVSRGYKLINGKTPITRLESNNPHHPKAFLKLRLRILQSAIKCTLACRMSTLQLLHYPLPDDGHESLDSYYICKLPLEELGTCFAEETCLSDLYKATDGYTLAVLKSLNELLCKQRSELLTRLSLTLSGTTWDFAPEGFLSQFTNILAEPHKTTIDCLASLQSCYDAHKNVVNLRDENQNLQSPNKASDKTSVLAINLHSLQVHMRAAMYMSMELEEKLSHGEIMMPDNFANTEMHLKAAMECWEECVKQFDLLSKKEDSSPPSEVGVCETVESSNDAESEVAKMIDVYEESDVEDQIFEATTEGRLDEDGCDFARGRGDADSSSKKIVEESATVIKELRSVLSVMTSEKQREMWKRQLFPTYAAKKLKAEIKNKNNSDSTSHSNGFVPNESGENLPANLDKIGENLSPKIVDLSEKIDLKPVDNDPTKDSSQKSEEAWNDWGCDKKLTFPKRVAPPGRPPSTHNRGKRPGRLPNQSEDDGDKNDSSDDENREEHSCSQPDKESTQCDDRMDWAVGLGIGFSNSLALQAVSAAKLRSGVNLRAAESVTYGGESDSDA